VLHVVLPSDKTEISLLFPDKIRTVIMTWMTRSPWCLPYTGVARAVARVIIFEEELFNFHTRLP
jgi:hypothetical protein